MRRCQFDTITRKGEQGFTLLELILAVAVVGALGLGLINVVDEIAQREIARSTAKYMERVSDAAVDLLEDPVFFDHFYQDISEEGGRKSYSLDMIKGYDQADLTLDDIQYVDVVSGLNVSVDIPDSELLSERFRNTNPYRAPVEYIFSIPSGSNVGDNPRSIDVLVVTTKKVADARVRRAASAAGPRGGFFSAIGEADPSDPVRLRSAYGVWEKSIGSLIGLSWHGDVTGTDKPTSRSGAYLLHYAYVNEDVISGDYLYRIAIPGRPELNRMGAPLILNENSILGADNMYVSGTATVNTQVVARGSVRTSGADGNLNAYGSMITDERLVAREVDVSNDLSDITRDTYEYNPAFTGANRIEIDTLRANEQIQAQTANLDVINARSMTTDNDVLIGGVIASNQNPTGGVEAGLIDVRDLRVNSGGQTVMNVTEVTRMQDVNFDGSGANALIADGGLMGVLTFQNNSSGSSTNVTGGVEGYRVNTNRTNINPSEEIYCEKGC